MSLISDALKRQEQLRAPGTGAAQREVAAAQPPEVAVAQPPEIAAAQPPEIAAPPEASSVSAQPRAASPRPTSPRQRPNLAAQAAQPRRVSGAPAANPFLERERAAARRPNHSILLMPVIGLLMLLVLLFLRREFVSPQPLQTATVKKVESEKWEVESSGGPGSVPAATPIDNPADAAVLSDLFPEKAKIQVETSGGPGAVPAAPTAENQKPKAETSGGPGAVPAETPIDVPKAESAPLRENPPPSNRQTVKPSNLAAEAPPQQLAWPAFTLTGIAVGRERLAILSTGEMLLAGETSKCGVKVEKVNASNVVFAWGSETKTLRKGEHSDKPANVK